MPDDTVNDEGVSPAGDLKQQNPGRTTTEEAAGTDEADPHKVEKLTRQGQGRDPDEGSD